MPRDTINSYQRTKKGIKNSFIAVSLQFVSILIGFFSRKIFLEYLGAEVLGLNTTAQSLLGFLNIAEMGIGSAIAVTLYKPLYDNDHQTIREIVALQGWLYKRIALVIMFASAVLMCFFPRIFAKTDLPLWYAYLSFSVVLFSSLLGYFVNYKQIVLSANQEDYKIQLTCKVAIIIKLIFQAIAVKFFPGNAFLWWCGAEVVITVISSIALNISIFKTAPYLRETILNAGSLGQKYPQVSTKVKQLFIHRIGGTLIFHASPVILYSFTSLSLVAIYGNYLLITNNLNWLLGSILTGLAAGLGSVIAEKNDILIKKLFRELYSIRFMMVSVCAICIGFLSQPFIKIWLGEEYLLSGTTLLLITINFWLFSMRSVTDSFISAYGLFSDVWSSLSEAALNLGLSILLGSFWGLNGIISGICISTLLIHYIWKPYFLFKCGLKAPLTIYLKVFFKHLAVLFVVFVAIFGLVCIVPVDSSKSLVIFLVYSAGMLSVTFVLFEGLLLLTDEGARLFLVRLKKIKG